MELQIEFAHPQGGSSRCSFLLPRLCRRRSLPSESTRGRSKRICAGRRDDHSDSDGIQRSLVCFSVRNGTDVNSSSVDGNTVSSRAL